MQEFEFGEAEHVLELVPFGPEPGVVVPACLVVTTLGVYQLLPDMAPEDIFLQILSSGGDPEPLGITLRLDLELLYSTGADKLFDRVSHT